MNILTLQPLLMKSRRFHIFPVHFSDGFGVRSTGGIAKKRRDDNDDDDHVKMRGWEESETRTIIFDRNTNHDYARDVVKSLQFSPMFLFSLLIEIKTAKIASNRELSPQESILSTNSNFPSICFRPRTGRVDSLEISWNPLCRHVMIVKCN